MMQSSLKQQSRQPNVENRRLCLVAQTMACLAIIVGAVGAVNTERSSLGPDQRKVYVQRSRA